MRLIRDRLFIGNDADCAVMESSKELSIIHACKTCHQAAVGYRYSLPKDHPEYLVLETPYDLYLNIIDPPKPLFWVESFRWALDFLQRHPENVLLHCNQGYSRAPSIALCHLARQYAIPMESYAAARKAYSVLDPLYQPGEGIALYLEKFWNDIIRGRLC